MENDKLIDVENIKVNLFLEAKELGYIKWAEYNHLSKENLIGDYLKLCVLEKWLREDKGILISIIPWIYGQDKIPTTYWWQTEWISTGHLILEADPYNALNKYEDALEDAIFEIIHKLKQTK